MTVRSDRDDIVSVVIPTAGRRPRQLQAAVASVASQTIKERVEVLIVDDSTDGIDQSGLTVAASPARLTVMRPSAAHGQRSTGVDTCTGRWIAFLDDDDTWEPYKLEAQVSMAEDIEARGGRAVVSCRVRHTFDGTSRVVPSVPLHVMGQGESVARYLFHARRPSVGRASLFTSTLLVSHALAEAVPWRQLPRHQDWDWLLRADALRDVEVAHHPKVLASIHVGSADSISASTDWRASLDWAHMHGRTLMDRESYADFLAAQVLRYALSARSSSGATSTLRELLTLRTLPTLTCAVVGLSGLLPRRSFESLMSLSARRRSGSASM